MTYVVAVDIGGTFTDFVSYDRSAGRVTSTKSPTTYEDFVVGVVECFAKARVAPKQAALINHGTTLVINALLQRRGAKCALVTTKGFRDILEIARGNRPEPFDLQFSRDEPLMPRELRFEIDERVDAAGAILRSPSEEDVHALAERLRAAGVESVAIFFINSYANPEPELALARALRRHLPDAYVTCSVDLTREWYEYERCATVCANAFVGPVVERYLNHLDDNLAAKDFSGSLFIMGSNGGLMSLEQASRRPIALVESGPVGGCIGAAAYARALGLPNVIAFDMGGTTAKCAHIADGRFATERIYHVGGYAHGFPVRSSVIDVTEVGAGGGSLARVDAVGRLTVGPQSAGSTPGPACYGRGGTEPTITDANLVLGRLNPDNFIGGELRLDAQAARAALGSISEPLGYRGEAGLVEIAEGVLTISTAIMADAVRRVSIERGLDPRDFVLFAYGGGGPLHAGALARELSIPTIVVPPEPGNFSALGMLLSDARFDVSRTFVRRLDDESLVAMANEFADMEAGARGALARDFEKSEIIWERRAEMRFVGQRHQILISVGGEAQAADLRRAFLDDYRRRYGHASDEALVEIQALHLAAFVRSDKPDIAHLAKRPASRAAPARRRVYYGADHGWMEAEVYQRSALAEGFAGKGPALIEEYGSTTLLPPGDAFSIGAFGEIRIASMCPKD